MAPDAPLPSIVPPAEPTGVRWYKNGLVAPMRRGALVSLAIGVAMLLLASSSMVTGEVTIFTLVLIFLMFYFTDNAMGRFFLAQRAPREVGFWEGGVIVRGARREDVFRWEEVADVTSMPVAGRFNRMAVRTHVGATHVYIGLPPELGTEVKVAWLEALARRGSSRMHKAPNAPAKAPPSVEPSPPSRIEPSRAPSFWRPAPPTPPAAPVRPTELPAMPPAAPPATPPATPPAAPPAAPAAAPPAAPPAQPGAAPPPQVPSAPPRSGSRPGVTLQAPPPPRPEWSFTQMESGAPVPDIRYGTQHGSVESFRWHFIPTAGSSTGAWLLLAVVVLASIVISRITADLALELLGFSSDPWTATGIGLGVGLAIALVFYRLARGEMSGEVAGSVIFLPMFDRTKADIADTLRDAGVSLHAGDARVRESRGRLIITWREAHTRAIVMQASHESRAIPLRSVGRSHFLMHQRLKGAILERLHPGNAATPPARPRR